MLTQRAGPWPPGKPKARDLPPRDFLRLNAGGGAGEYKQRPLRPPHSSRDLGAKRRKPRGWRGIAPRRLA
jgi:hypothetical protein